MGNSCGDFKDEIDTTNICNDQLNEIFDSKGFCTLRSSHHSYRDQYCDSLSDGEWTRTGNGGYNCHYNSCDEKTQVTTSAGCCNGCCAITGEATKCKRIAFKGDPLGCCFRDLKCNSSSTNEFCFADTAKRRTCLPEHRDKSSVQCQHLIYQYCTAPNENDAIFFARWLGDVVIDGHLYERPCYHALYRNLFKEQAGACSELPNSGYPNSQGFIWSKDLISGTMKRYTTSGYSLDSRPGEITNVEFNAMLWDICSNNPGVCQPALNLYCNSATTDLLIRRPGLQPWCSCYLSDATYSKYTNLYQINKECSPICNVKGVLPLPDDSGTSVKTCQQSICIIDDVAINIAESKVGVDGGSISFAQMCGSCGGGTCSCVFSNTTLTIIESDIDYIGVEQQCSGNSKCYSEVVQPDGSIIPVEINCTATDLNAENPYADIEQQNAYNEQQALNKRNWLVLILFILLGLFIVFIWNITSPPPPINDILKVPLIPKI